MNTNEQAQDSETAVVPRSRVVSAAVALKKQPTGLPELDVMLQGGLPIGSAVILAGTPGTGKTMLSLQWLFAGYNQFREPGLYISMTEPVSKILRNVAGLSFFKPDLVNPVQIHFTDLRGVIAGLQLAEISMTRDEVTKLIDTVLNLVKQMGAKRVVIDSVSGLGYRLADPELVRDFIFRLGSALAQLDATVILVSEAAEGEKYSVFGVEEFIADGIIQIASSLERGERIRRLEVVKMRGTDFDSHPATLRLTGRGVVLFPRLARVLTHAVSTKRARTGSGELDAMTGGGFFEGSAVLLSGASGTGKSLFATQFLNAGLEAGEPGVYFSFEESREQVIRNAAGLGWDLKAHEEQGRLKIASAFPEQYYLEEYIDYIIDTVTRTGARRVVIDSLSSLAHVYSDDILRDFTARLIGFFKNNLVTAVLTNASSSMLGATSITESGLSTMTDTIINLRFVEIESELRHAILIVKMRGSKHDKHLREYVISPAGLKIASSFAGYEGVISGSTRKVGASVEERLRALFAEFLGPMGQRLFEEEKAKGLTPASVRRLVEQLGQQGVISSRRHVEFRSGIDGLFGPEESEPAAVTGAGKK